MDRREDWDPENTELICALIEGKNNPEYEKISWAFDIVNNKRNSIDVDKFDYIKRDTSHVNIDLSFDWSRLVNSSRVMDNQICYSSDSREDIFGLFNARHTMFQNVYYHPKT